MERFYMTSCHSAMLLSPKNKTAVMLVPNTGPLGVELFSYVNSLFGQESENALFLKAFANSNFGEKTVSYYTTLSVRTH